MTGTIAGMERLPTVIITPVSYRSCYEIMVPFGKYGGMGQEQIILQRNTIPAGQTPCAGCNHNVLYLGPRTPIALPTAVGWAMNQAFRAIPAGQPLTRLPSGMRPIISKH